MPGLDINTARSLLTEAQATAGKAMRELDAYFEAEPDALRRPVSQFPASYMRLVLVIGKSGYEVTMPVCAMCGRAVPHLRAGQGGRVCSRCYARSSRTICARCGQEGRIAARRPEGIICYTCYARDPLAFEPCVQCGNLRVPARRLEDGRSLCGNCSPRPIRTCTVCGLDAPTKTFRDGQAVCISCYRTPERLCGRCQRVAPISLRATEENPDLCDSCHQGVLGACTVCGRIRPCQGVRVGRLICKSCLPLPPRPCCRCGRNRPVNAEWPIGPVCSTCYEHIRNHPESCARCGDIQPLIALSDGEGICGPCAGVAVDYVCRRCGSGGQIYAEGTCARCVLVERVNDLLEHPASGSQLSSLRDALIAVEHPVTILGWLRKSASAQLLAQLAADEQPITHQLLDGLPPSRNMHYLRQVLVHTGVLPERVEYLERVGPWLEQLLLDAPASHAQLVRPYAHWYVLRRARRASLRRSYTQGAGAGARRRIKMALDFLGWLDEQQSTLGDLKQEAVECWLTGGSKTRYDVRSFLAWTADRGLTPHLKVPARSFRQYGDQLLAEEECEQQLRRCIGDTSLPIEVRAAGALVTLFGIPVSRLVALTADRLITKEADAYLVVSQRPVLLPPVIAELLRMSAQTQTRSAVGRTIPGTQ